MEGIKAWNVGYTSGLMAQGENFIFWLDNVWRVDRIVSLCCGISTFKDSDCHSEVGGGPQVDGGQPARLWIPFLFFPGRPLSGFFFFLQAHTFSVGKCYVNPVFICWALQQCP